MLNQGLTQMALLVQHQYPDGVSLQAEPYLHVIFILITQRFDVIISVEVLVRHYIENKNMAARRYSGRNLYEMICVYYHDDPALKYGGREISRSEVMPKYDLYLNNMCGNQKSRAAEPRPLNQKKTGSCCG